PKVTVLLRVTVSLVPKARVPLSVSVTDEGAAGLAIWTLAPAPTVSVPPDEMVTFWPKVEVAATAARERDPPDAIERAAPVSFSERTAKLPAPMVMVPPDVLIVTSSALVGTAPVDQLPASPQLSVPALPVQVTGVRRSSRSSTLGRRVCRRCLLADLAR